MFSAHGQMFSTRRQMFSARSQQEPASLPGQSYRYFGECSYKWLRFVSIAFPVALFLAAGSIVLGAQEERDQLEPRVTTGGVEMVDIGANLNNRTTLRDERNTFVTVLAAYLRSDPEVRDRGTFNFLLQGSVTNRTESSENEWETEWLPDLDRLRLGGTFPHAPVVGAVYRQRIGRFVLSEPSELVFSGRVDGIALDIDFTNVDLQLAGGYTGLIGKHNSSVALTAADRADRNDDTVFFAPPRLLALTSVGLPEVIGRHSVNTGVLAQFDRRRGEAGEAVDRLDTQHGFLVLDGPVGGGLYYDAAVASVLEQRHEAGQDDPELALGISGRLRSRFLFGADDRHIITLNSRYGSGDDEIFAPYTSISAPSLDLLNPYSGQDLILGSLEYAVRPLADSPLRGLRSLQLTGYGATAFTADPTRDGSYRGTEAGARVNMRPFSDFGGRIWTGAYFPGDETETARLIGRFDLSMSY